jgi:Calx-beta domain
MRSSRVVCGIALALSLTAITSASTPQTFLTLISQPGDYIGQGTTETYTSADGTFTVNNTSNTISISFHTPSYSHTWLLQFGTPTSQKFGHGEFEGAQRTAFRSPTRPGIDVSGDGRGCNTDTGRFLVSDFVLNADGTVARLAIDFEQHCEGSTPALYGSFRYKSAVPAVPRFGIGSTYALKGNEGTSDAAVIVSLCLPGSNTVQVNYTTADGNAVQGTDYVSTSGTVSFAPGETSHSIVMPVIGDRLPRGNKSFKVKLSAPSGAPIGALSASVLIRDPNISQSVLAMSSQPGDYIGQGGEYLITLSDGTFTASNSANVVGVSVSNEDGWTVDLVGPTSARLGVGDYENAQRYPFQPAGTPGLSVYGAARGCNTLTGDFQVLKAGYNSSSVLQTFSANFEQHCEGAAPALFGWLRYHTMLQQFSVSNAVVSGSNATFTVTLNPASATTVSVAFATADGTAVAGADYMSTSETVTFSPGMTSQTVTVPLLNTGSAKTFYGELSSPTGAAVWVRKSSATF